MSYDQEWKPNSIPIGSALAFMDAPSKASVVSDLTIA
jgi:hypothetical protein